MHQRPLKARRNSMSDVRLIPASQVDPDLRTRVSALVEQHRDELPGLLRDDWDRIPATQTFVVLDARLDEPVGLVTWTGAPTMADPSWWTRPDRRGNGREPPGRLVAIRVFACRLAPQPADRRERAEGKRDVEEPGWPSLEAL